MVKDGAFRARKRCGSKPLLMDLKSCVCIIWYPTTTRGRLIVVQPCSDPKEDLVNEQGLVDETSAQSINMKHGSC
jgi:hypothetical protein